MKAALKAITAAHWKAIAAFVGALVAQAVLVIFGKPVPADLLSAFETMVQLFGPVVVVYFFPANKVREGE